MRRLSEEELAERMRVAGHEPRRTDAGDIDWLAHDISSHNGPVCLKCGWGACMHCPYEWQDLGPCEPE